MIATLTNLEPAVLPAPAPTANGTTPSKCHGSSRPEASRASDPAASPSVPSCLSASVPSSSPLVPCASSLMPLSPSDESLLLSLLDANLSLSFLIRHHKMTLNQALEWWRQPHIKQALAELTDLSQARARAIAANDATHAVTALQSCLVLSDTEFYEQADPKTRLRAFESARKAATQVLRLAGITSAPSRSTPRAITRGPERVMLPYTPLPKSTLAQATAASAHPRPVLTGRGVRGSARTERGVPASEPAQQLRAGHPPNAHRL